MILIDNLNLLTQKYPQVLKVLKETEVNPDLMDCFKVLSTKSSLPTLTFEKEGKIAYIHSKYNPQEEAEKFIEQFTDLSRYQQIFFYGVGLGYHIETLMSKCPDKKFTIFEPNPAVLYHYVSTKRLANLPLKNLEQIFLDVDPKQTFAFLNKYANLLLEDVLFVFLPSYERLFSEEYKRFHSQFINIVTATKNNMYTSLLYEKKWLVNSMVNFEEVINTPNIVYSFKDKFKDKPVIIVAAGPSVNDEIENLRVIKENGLAYLFAVSSGLVPLLHHNIVPDAVLAYDPNDNLYVFQKMIDENITHVPLIFGSSVGTDIFPHYPGPKLHMIINQDSIAPAYLKFTDGRIVEVVPDAPTISIIAIHLLSWMGFNPIILAGQNLAYRDNQSRADGINYYNSEVNDMALKGLFPVESVTGGKVYTSKSFNNMRLNMELIIGHYRNLKVINCTKDGAKIKGADFIPLESLIETELKDQVVDSNWYHCNAECYDPSYMLHVKGVMEQELVKLERIFRSVEDSFKVMKLLSAQNNLNQLNKEITKLDQKTTELLNNLFFTIFLKPMRRVEFDILTKIVHQLQKENAKAKAERAIREFGKFINGCKNDIELITPIYQRMNELIDEKAKRGVVNV